MALFAIRTHIAARMKVHRQRNLWPFNATAIDDPTGPHIWSFRNFDFRRTLRGGSRRETDGFHQDGLAMGREHPDEATTEGVEPSPSTDESLPAARARPRIYPEQLTGSFARHLLGNYRSLIKTLSPSLFRNSSGNSCFRREKSRLSVDCSSMSSLSLILDS